MAIDAIRSQPLVGYGAAGSVEVFSVAMENGSLRLAPVRNSHNRVLETWIMFGLLGLVLTGLAIAQPLRGLSRGGAPESEAILVYLAVSGLTTPGSGSAFVDPLLMAFVVALAGLAAHSSDFASATPTQRPHGDPARPAPPRNPVPRS